MGDEGVLAEAYAASRRGGTTVTVGLPDPERMLSIPAVSLVAEERTLRGSYLGSCVPERDIPRFVALYRAGRLPVDRLVATVSGSRSSTRGSTVSPGERRSARSLCSTEGSRGGDLARGGSRLHPPSGRTPA